MSEITIFGSRLSPFVEKVCGAAAYKRIPFALSPFVPGPARPFAGPLLRRLIGRAPKVQGLGRLPYDVLIRETGERLDDLVLLLGKRTFFYADRPSVADFALYGEFSNGCGEATPDFAGLVSERPSLADWMKRVEDCTRH